MSRLATNPPRLVLSLAIGLCALLAYEGVRRCDFVAFDDDLYVYRNPWVSRGLTWDGVRWAFSADLLFESPHADYWMPLTILTRMLDVEAFGLDAGGHHLSNVALHGLYAILGFLALDAMTGARRRSAFVGALLAVHPLTVESVAWVTERKDLLSGVMFMLALLAWNRYATRGGRAPYLLALLCMLLGCMSKPTLVMLPAILLVLDYWPLGRLRGPASVPRLLVEKAPFAALAVGSAALTLLAHSRGGHLAAVDALPLGVRLANALVSPVIYLGKALWPAPLAVFYPYERHAALGWQALLSGSLLAGATWLVARNAARHGYRVTGWSWFLLCLLPVLGIVQTGQQGRADRFMYLPLAGLGILASWGGAELASRSRALERAAPVLVGVTLCAWIAVTRAQVRTWQNTVTLFSHAVSVTRGNHLAHGNLATALGLLGRDAEAERHYREAVRFEPRHWKARTGLGVLLMRSGRLAEALEQQREALRLNPGSAEVLFNLGTAEARAGEARSAQDHYAAALQINPEFAAAHYNWGNLLAQEGRWPEAEARFREAVRLAPEDVDARNNLGLSVGLQGRWAEAVEILNGALRAAPGHAQTRINLARAFTELGRHSETRAAIEEGLRRAPGDPSLLQALRELAR